MSASACPSSTRLTAEGGLLFKVAGVKGKYDMKARVQLWAWRAHLWEHHFPVLTVGHAALKSHSRTLMFGFARDKKPQSLRGTEIERSTRGDFIPFACARVCVCVFSLNRS